MPRKWKRGTCGVCGEPMWLYRGTDGDVWIHDEPQTPLHQAKLSVAVPEPVAEAADLRNDEVRFMPQVDPDEDAFDYGEPKEMQTGW